ncbi:MAG: hypothetical protein ACREJB_08025 [Planctomycetaceae bacterium]
MGYPLAPLPGLFDHSTTPPLHRSALMLFLLFALWLALILGLSHLTKHLVARSSSGFAFRLLIFPGVVVHELSHWAMCRLTGARVYELKLFERRREAGGMVYGGHVKHGRSKLPIVGDPLIAFAPTVGGLGLLVLLTWLFDDPLGLRGALAGPTDPITDARSVVAGLASVLAKITIGFPRRVLESAGDWKLWLYLYLACSISVSLSPSGQDFQNSLRHFARHFAVFVAITAVLLAAVWWGGGLWERWDVSGWTIRSLFGVMALTIATQVLACAIALVLAGIAKIARNVTPR